MSSKCLYRNDCEGFVYAKTFDIQRNSFPASKDVIFCGCHHRKGMQEEEISSNMMFMGLLRYIYIYYVDDIHDNNRSSS